MAKKKEMKPEKLESVTTNKGIPKAKAKPEKLSVITISDLPRPRKITKAERLRITKSRKSGENIVITTGDFKPRKFKDMAKL